MTQEEHEQRVLSENPHMVKKENTVKYKNDKRTVFLWLSNQFELKPDEFYTILETLQHGGNIGMQRMNTILKNEALVEILRENGFPVKIEIPIGFTVKAKVVFSNFRFLSKDDACDDILPQDAYSIDDLFNVPDYLERTSRKEGMKTMKNKKKRLAFANFYYS